MSRDHYGEGVQGGEVKSLRAVPGLRIEAYLKRRGKKADVNGLLATRVQNDVWAWAVAIGQAFWGGGSEVAKGPVLMSESPSATVGHAETCGLGHHLGPCWCPRVAMWRGHEDLGPW